jgi:protein SCO1/2
MSAAPFRLILAACSLIAAGNIALAARFDPFAETAISPAAGAKLDLRATVLDQTGRALPMSSLTAGLPILFVPVQHRCPNICGVTLAGLSDALAQMPEHAGADYTVIAFGIDPHEGVTEKQAGIAVWRDPSHASLDGIWATTASSDVIAVETSALGYRFAWDPDLRQFAHPAAIAVLTADGRLVRWLAGLQPDPRTLRSALAEARADRVPSVLAQAAVFLCYRYDPSTGRLTPSILAGFQLLGGLSVLALAALMLAVQWRARTGARRS